MADRNKLIIPKELHVGYQNRSDTYTGKLAYVIYKDAKGVLRKEKSWNGWRDQKISIDVLDNTPTSGFVLNKKVGGYGGWNPRQTWVRIYDPRNFEFEISVANLLFILEETSAIKGKGLEGEFVYSWDGTELVLLPVTSQEYKNSSEFTDLQTKKVTKNDIKEGCLYVTKDMEKVMYLGRHHWYELTRNYGYNDNYDVRYALKCTKQHIFVSVDGKSNYWPQDGFTKLAGRLSEEPSPLFPDEFEKFKKSVNGSRPVELVGEPKPITISKLSDYGANYGYLKLNDKFHYSYLHRSWRNYHYGSQGILQKEFELFTSPAPVVINQTTMEVLVPGRGSSGRLLSDTELAQLDWYTLNVKNEEGALIPL